MTANRLQDLCGDAPRQCSPVNVDSQRRGCCCHAGGGRRTLQIEWSSPHRVGAIGSATTRKPHVECLLCRKKAGQQDRKVQEHLHDCFLRGPASPPHAVNQGNAQSAGAPAQSAASAACAAGGAAGWAGRAAAAGDRVLVLELTSQQVSLMA